MLNKLTGLLASATLVAGIATSAFAHGSAPAVPRSQNPSPMQGQGMMNGQRMQNGESMMGDGRMMGMMRIMTRMNR